MIKYTIQAGDISEEFQFENIDELLKYLDWRKYDTRMEEQSPSADLSWKANPFTGEVDTKPEDMDGWTYSNAGGQEHLSVEKPLEEMTEESREACLKKMKEMSEAQKKKRHERMGMDEDFEETHKDILMEAFDRIGVVYEDKGDFLIIEERGEGMQLCDMRRLDINFDDDEHGFSSFEYID